MAFVNDGSDDNKLLMGNTFFLHYLTIFDLGSEVKLMEEMKKTEGKNTSYARIGFVGGEMPVTVVLKEVYDNSLIWVILIGIIFAFLLLIVCFAICGRCCKMKRPLLATPIIVPVIEKTVFIPSPAKQRPPTVYREREETVIEEAEGDIWCQ